MDLPIFGAPFTPAMFYNLVVQESGDWGMQVPPAMDQFPAMPEPQPNPGLFSQPDTSFMSPESLPTIAPPTFSVVPDAFGDPFMLNTSMSFM